VKIRTAILGYGRSGGHLHAGVMEANTDDFELVAVCDIDPERQKQAADRFGCAIHDDYHKMLESEDLDLVCVVTRSDQHCQMTCDCLAAGASVLVTKPWAVDAGEARRMIDAQRSAGAALIPWLPARWGRPFLRLKELVAENAIGNVFLVRRVVSSFATRSDWQTERRYGGGYLLNWGPHIVDPPVLLGNGPVKSVYARMKQTINPGDTEDVFLAVMNLEDGTVVQAEYTIAVRGLAEWILQGDRGTIVVNGDHLTLCKNTPAEPGDPTRFYSMKSQNEETIEEEIEGPAYGSEHQIYREVAQALRGEKDFPVTPEDALELSRVLDAIRTSSVENRVVEL